MSGYGLMCTVMWTELVKALREDGVEVPDRSGPAAAKVVRDTVQAVFGNRPSRFKVYSYAEQPDNLGAWRLGKAAEAAQPGGRPIDHGLSLLKFLQDEGYGVVKLEQLR